MAFIPNSGGGTLVSSGDAQLSDKVLSSTIDVDFNDVYAYTGNEFISKYPTVLPGRNEEFYAASQQSGWEITKNAFLGFGNLAVNSFLNHFVQTGTNIGNLATADFGNLWDSNEMQKMAASTTLANQYKFPIYQSQKQAAYDEKNKGLLGTLGGYIPGVGGSGRRWGQLGQQLGFTAGTFGAFAAEQVAMNYLLPGSGAVKLPSSASKLIKSVFQLGKFTKQLETAKTTSNLTDAGIFMLRMGNLATGEASLEANMASIEFQQHQIGLIEEKFGRMPTPQELMDIQEASKKVGDFTFGVNVPVLMVSNMMVLPTILKPKGLLKGAYRESVENLTKKAGKYYTQKELANTMFKKVGLAGKNFVKKTIIPSIGEGFEELAQGLGSRTAQNYYSTVDNDYGKSNQGLIKALGDEITHSFGSGEGWQELVSGWMIGLIMGGGNAMVNKFAGKKGQSDETARDIINSGITNFTDNYKIHPKMMAANTYVATNVEQARAEAEGNVKAVKDHRAQVEGELFSLMHMYGLGAEYIDTMLDSLNTMNEQELEEFMGGRTREEFRSHLLSKSKEWSQRQDRLDILYPSKGLTGEEFKIHNDVKKQINNLYHQLEDTVARSENIVQDLQSKTKDPRVAELFSKLADPEALNQMVTELEQALKLSEEVAKSEGMSAEDKKLQRNQIKKDKQWLAAVKDARDSLVNEDGTAKENYAPEKAATSILKAVKAIDPTLTDLELQPLMRDMFLLENEGSELLTLVNALENKKVFDSFYKGFKAEYLRKKKKIASEPAPVVESSQDAEKVVEESGMSKKTREEVLEALDEITPSGGKFAVMGQEFDTLDEAQNYVLEGQARNNPALADPEVLQAIKIIHSAPAQTNVKVTDQEYNEAIADDKKLVALVESKLINKDATTYTPKERELFLKYAALKAKEKKEAQVKKEQQPKTKKEVSGSYSFNPNAGKGILTHFFGIALASIKKALGSTQLSKRVKELGTIKDTTATVLMLNDSIADGKGITIHLEDSATKEEVKQSLEQEGIAIIKDNRGRLIVLTKDDPRKVIREKLGLYISNSAEGGKYSDIRQGDENGEVIGSSFDQDLFDDRSVRKINKIKVGDRVTLVVSNTEYNVKLARDFVAKGSPTEEQYLEFFDELVLDLRVDGVTVGRIKAGNYFAKMDNMGKATLEIRKLRNYALTKSALEALYAGKSFQTGTVKVNQVNQLRNIAYNKDGTQKFVTLREYEENSPDAKITYFVGVSGTEIVDKNGKRISKDEAQRKTHFRVGAVYARIEHPESGHTIILQAAADEAKTYTQEDLKSDGFKDELEIHLRPGKPPVHSKQLIVSPNSFKPSVVTTEDVEQQLRNLEEEGQVNLVVDGVEISLRDIVINYDKQTIEGRALDGQPLKFSFGDINGVEVFTQTVTDPVLDEIYQQQKSLYDLLESARAVFDNIAGVSLEAKISDFIIGLGQLTEISDKIIKALPEGNIIKEVYNQNPELVEKVFNKLAVINDLFIGLDQTSSNSQKPTKQEFFSQVEPSERELWLNENGEVGEEYILEDGTVLTIVDKDEEGMTINKDGFNIRVGKQESASEIVEDLKANGVSDSELYDILNSDQEVLSLRHHLIKQLYPDRLNMLEGRINRVKQKTYRSYNQYISESVKRSLRWLFGVDFDVEGQLLIPLVEKYIELSVRKQKPETLAQLMREAGIAQESIEAIQNGLSFASYITIWAYVTQAETMYGFARSSALRDFIMGDRPSVLRATLPIESANLIATPPDKRDKAVEKYKSTIEEILLRQSLYVKGWDGLDESNVQQFAAALKEFFNKVNENTTPKELVRALLVFNTQIRDTGMSLDINSLAQTRMGQGMGRTVLANDSANFLDEFKDSKLIEQLGKKKQRGDNTVKVKYDDGGFDLVPLEDLTELRSSEAVLNDVDVVEGLLPELSREDIKDYVAAYHSLNGDATEMLYRIKTVKEFISRQQMYAQENNQSQRKDYFNPKKVEKEVESETCE